jgi:hypothetical protein
MVVETVKLVAEAVKFTIMDQLVLFLKRSTLIDVVCAMVQANVVFVTEKDIIDSLIYIPPKTYSPIFSPFTFNSFSGK